jgi:hypothetical protein
MPILAPEPKQRLLHGEIKSARLIHSSRSTRAFLLLVIALALLVGLQFFVPIRTAIKIGADEDWELSKATLSLNGYHFYTDVWNDQPLLHTWIITNLLKHVSPTVLGPRLVTSAFALLLITAVFWNGSRFGGVLVGTLAALLVIASPGFLELSSSCMVEIPAMAPAVAAIAALIQGSKFKVQRGRKSGPLTLALSPGEGEGSARGVRAWIWCVLAGVLFGISLQIKFINLVLLPMVALILWLQRSAAFTPPKAGIVGTLNVGPGAVEGSTLKRRERRAPLLVAPLALFGVALMATFVGITFLTGAEAYWVQLKQSWSAHFAATKSFEYGSPADHPFEWSVYLRNWDTTIPALIGILFCLRNFRTQPLLLVPVAWFALTFVVFGMHKPWWSYYYVHNAVPLCICAAIGIAAVVQWLRQRRRILVAALASLAALVIAGWMGARVYLQITQIRSSPKIYSSLALKEIERYKPLTKFIYTDEPAYSFHSGIPMPPALAVITLKRLWSGDMTNARIVEELKLSKPGLMLLKNQTAELPFSDWMQTEYRLVYQDGRHNLYAHKSIANKVE